MDHLREDASTEILKEFLRTHPDFHSRMLEASRALYDEELDKPFAQAPIGEMAVIHDDGDEPCL